MPTTAICPPYRESGGVWHVRSAVPPSFETPLKHPGLVIWREEMETSSPIDVDTKLPWATFELSDCAVEMVLLT
eukprot:CAMPEP_0169143092 /NCGR_PEP_ID=MMETSP1015-20121227/45378_1 /TAXON_ID=342587 /ORGANISM="Karlodinium micrum, Strain CCMP2283" /LENGTH=73 /DNA_ID=CAMNT_0009209961 /DNA_START=1 /DNA_END=218 /DNA_ORIENTATION=-